MGVPRTFIRADVAAQVRKKARVEGYCKGCFLVNEQGKELVFSIAHSHSGARGQQRCRVPANAQLRESSAGALGPVSRRGSVRGVCNRGRGKAAITREASMPALERQMIAQRWTTNGGMLSSRPHATSSLQVPVRFDRRSKHPGVKAGRTLQKSRQRNCAGRPDGRSPHRSQSCQHGSLHTYRTGSREMVEFLLKALIGSHRT